MYIELKICSLDNLDINHPKSLYPRLVKFIGEEQANAFVDTVDVPLGKDDT
jgi:hypothetical protein